MAPSGPDLARRDASVDDRPGLKAHRKGHNNAAQLCYVGNVLMENRNGLIVDLAIDTATGHAERHGALALLDAHLPNSRGVTLGADAGYDTADFVAACRERWVTPHIAQTATNGAAPRWTAGRHGTAATW